MESKKSKGDWEMKGIQIFTAIIGILIMLSIFLFKETYVRTDMFELYKIIAIFLFGFGILIGSIIIDFEEENKK